MLQFLDLLDEKEETETFEYNHLQYYFETSMKDSKKGMHKITPRVFLPKDSIERCSKCNKYLSVGPIKLEKNEPVCGRCSETKGNPAHLYENLAQFMFFPCINDAYGCDATLAWGSIELHEKGCKFFLRKCPAITCEERIESDQIISHFQSKHQDLLITTNKFTVPCRRGDATEYVNKLTVSNKEPFIVKINYSSFHCFCSILAWNICSKNLKYSIIIEDDRKRQSLHIKDIPVSEYRIKYHDNLTMTKIDMSTVKRMLSLDKFKGTFSLGIESSSENVLNTNLLSELECPICTYYMKPPIYMCTVGHSLCSSCKEKISSCPSCQVEMETNRNFALEKVAGHINFPCKFRDHGCSFKGKISEVGSHELHCSATKLTETECYCNYISPCEWRGKHTEAIPHISLLHPKFYLNIKDSIYLDLQIFKTFNVFIGNQGKSFKFCVTYINMTAFKFTMKIVKTNMKINEKFNFFIDFKDLNGCDRILHLNKDCITCLANDDSLNNCLTIPYALLKPFIKNYNLQFKINIVKV